MTLCSCQSESECRFGKRGYMFEVCRGTARKSDGTAYTEDETRKYREMFENGMPPRVGYVLATMIVRMGLGDEKCQLCSELATEMDRLGPDGVEAERARFVEHLVKQAAGVSLWDAAWGLANSEPRLAILIGLWKAAHPLTPTAEIAANAILDCAIERATQVSSRTTDIPDTPP